MSGARYNPSLDLDQGVDREHVWPVSHCEKYVQRCCNGEGRPPKAKKARKIEKGKDKESVPSSPMHAAAAAHNSLPSLQRNPSVKALYGLWLGRVCRTASHELGHCFGIAHCIYYACAMQSTASIIEDSRQPPYLCPIDLAKVLTATGADVVGRYKALIAFCDQYKETQLLASYAAWMAMRIEEEEHKTD